MYKLENYSYNGTESTDNVLKLIGEQIDNFKAQGLVFLCIDIYNQANRIEKDKYVPYATYKEEITKIIKDTKVTDFYVGLTTGKGDILYRCTFDLVKYAGTCFCEDTCEEAYKLGGVKTTWVDYSYPEPIGDGEEWDTEKFYRDFDDWWINLPNTEQKRIYSAIFHKEVI
jgi:hypothetical protein